LSVRRIALAGFCRATTGSLYRHGLPRPARRCGDDILAISDSFPRAVRRGLLRFHPGIVAVDGDEVRFDDGSSARVDVIIHATGFDLPTGFLPEAARPEPARLYRGIAHTDVEDLYFVGLIEAHRALLPIVERQAAWTAHVLKGTRRLPGRDVQRRVAAREAARQRRDFGERRPFLVDHARYMASLRREH
jgi:hypothetical protein